MYIINLEKGLPVAVVMKQNPVIIKIAMDNEVSSSNVDSLLLNNILKKKRLKLNDSELSIIHNYIKQNSDDDISDSKVQVILQEYQKLKKNHLSFPQKVFPLPNPFEKYHNAIDSMYICAPRGAGKSTFCRDYIKLYKKQYPKNKIIVISQKDEDKAFKSIQKYLTYLPMTVDDIDDEMDLDEIKETLILFDDYECFSPRALQNYVNNFRDKILKVGRSKKITCLICQHAYFSGWSTRVPLLECDSYVLFKDMMTAHFETFLINKLGFSLDEFRRIKEIPFRWMMFRKSSPRYIIYDHGAMIM